MHSAVVVVEIIRRTAAGRNTLPARWKQQLRESLQIISRVSILSFAPFGHHSGATMVLKLICLHTKLHHVSSDLLGQNLMFFPYTRCSDG